MSDRVQFISFDARAVALRTLIIRHLPRWRRLEEPGHDKARVAVGKEGCESELEEVGDGVDEAADVAEPIKQRVCRPIDYICDLICSDDHTGELMLASRVLDQISRPRAVTELTFDESIKT